MATPPHHLSTRGPGRRRSQWTHPRDDEGREGGRDARGGAGGDAYGGGGGGGGGASFGGGHYARETEAICRGFGAITSTQRRYPPSLSSDLWHWEGGHILTTERHCPPSSVASTAPVSSTSDTTDGTGSYVGTEATLRQASISSGSGSGAGRAASSSQTSQSPQDTASSRGSFTSRRSITAPSAVSSASSRATTARGEWMVRGGPRSESDWRGYRADPDSGDTPPVQTNLHTEQHDVRICALNTPPTTTPTYRGALSPTRARSLARPEASQAEPTPYITRRGQFASNAALLANCYTTGVDPTAVAATDGARSGWSAKHLGRVAAPAPTCDEASAGRRRLLWGSSPSAADPQTTLLTSRRLFSQSNWAGPPDWRNL
jgi:hypothetical protein